jgi:hypothetical protein
MRQLATRLLRLYPRWWRERYEAEVGGLLEEHRVQLTTLADLVAGAVDARLNPTYRQKEDLMSSSARQGPQAVEREVAVDHDEVSREEIRAELQAREAKLQASADAVQERKKKSIRNSPFTEAQEAALGPTLFTSPRSN